MKKLDNSVFERWTHLAHPLIEKYKPVFLDRGEEYIVYTLTDKTDIVVKINIDSIIESLDSSQNKEEHFSVLQKIADFEGARYATLTNVYSDQHVPKTDFKILTIPINKEVIIELCNIKKIDTIEHYPDEILAIIMIQGKIEGLDDPERRFISSQYSERYDLPIEMYGDITNKLVFKLNDRPFLVEDFILVQDIRRNHIYPLSRLIKHLQEDARLAEVVKDFILHTKKYVDRHDTILDLAGRKNFAFLPDRSGDNKEWNYKLIDVLYPRKGYKLSQMRENILNYVITKGDTTLHEDILMTINFIRVMNGLSDMLGLGRIFDQLNKMDVNPEDLYRILHAKVGLSPEQLKIAVFDPPEQI